MFYSNLNDIEKVIAMKEGGNVEFKLSTGQLDRGMETLCAFLNGSGGTLLFGVSDGGKLIGQEISDQTKRNLADGLMRFEPTPKVDIQYFDLPGTDKKVISIYAEPAFALRPFTYRGRAYSRIQSVTTTMSQATYAGLLLVREGYKYPWESFAYPNATLDDIDDKEVINTVKAGIDCGRLPEGTGFDVPSCLEKFGLLNNGVLNNAAMVLFANREIPTFTQCMVRMARFMGTNKMVFLDNHVAMGNLFRLMDAAMDFVFKHLCLSGWNTNHSLEREEHLTVPYKAVREGLLNAFCHRSYRSPGGAVSLAIYDDRLEIENPAELPPDFNIEVLKREHQSHPHNNLIANVLYRRKFTENWGRGISLIMEECSKVGLPEPEYKLGFDSIRLVFRYESIYRLPSSFTVEELNSTTTPQVPPKYEESTPQVPPKYEENTPQVPPKLGEATVQGSHRSQDTDHLSPHVRFLSTLVDDNSSSIGELMEAIGLKDRKSFRERYLKEAMEKGVLEFVYPDQPNSPKQRYRLTELGKKLKAEFNR